MTTASAVQVNVTATVSQKSNGFVDRLNNWLNDVIDAFFGPAVGDAIHDDPAEAYLFLNTSGCGGVIDTKLWDLLIDRKAQPETEEDNNV